MTQPCQNQFDIIFVKLDEALSADRKSAGVLSEAQTLETELEEIAELRRIVLEITEPEPSSYTST